MFDSSIGGIQAGIGLMNSAARRIACDEGDDVGNQVDMMIAPHTIESNLVALKSQISAQKFLIDILA